jgi:hypothetical protein
MRNVRLLNGVTVDDEGETLVRVTASPRASGREVDVTIGASEGSRVHYRSVVELGEAGEADAAGVTGNDHPRSLPELEPFPISVDDAYRDLLFHGPLFQRIAAVDGLGAGGAAARLRPSTPGGCVAGCEDLDWLLDPILLDSALQMQLLWARLQWDVTLLPTEVGSYRRIAGQLGGQPVRHELRIRPKSKPPLCHADHHLFGVDGRLLATMDVLGVGTRALNRLVAVRT